MNQKDFRNLKQKLNIHIVEWQPRVKAVLYVLSLLVSLVTIASIICYHGFYITLQTKEIIRTIVHVSLIFYTLKYFTFLFYSVDSKRYIKETFVEFIIILLLIFNWFCLSVFNVELPWFNYNNFDDSYLLIIQFYFLIMVFVEISKASRFLTRLKLSPPTLMMFSFGFLIAIGTLLLMLPRMTTNGITFIDALFTATSASCVTGLTVLNTGSTFTFKGLVVIMLLIQLGGLSILSYATFFTTFLSKSSAGLRYQHLIKDLMSTNKLSDSFLLLKEIFLTTLIIEAVGVGLLYMYWKTTGLFIADGKIFFYAIFHTISAFNNAGFSLWDANLMDAAIANNYFPQAIIMILVFLGGIGFVTLSDFFNPKIIRERKKFRWKQLMPGTKIILYTTFGIILVGTLIFFFVEYNHSLADKGNFLDKFLTALFQTVVGRTAGFNMVNVNLLAVPTMLLLMLIMFIGASPGSTGGGIKTTTFFVLLKSVFATIRGKKSIEFQRRTIPFDLVDKAYSITLMSFFLIFMSAFFLSLAEPDVPLVTLLFESISAFTTCGLSTGACADFSIFGKSVLVVNMYIGRIGMLKIAYALSKRVKESKHQYPETYITIG